MKKIFVIGFGLAAAWVASADPTVGGVSAALSANDNVYTVSYTLAGAPAIVTVDVKTNGVSIGGEHIVTLAGDVNAPIATDGAKSFTWDVGRDWDSAAIGTIPVDIVVTAWTKASPPDVMVLDLLANSSAPVKYYENESFLPGGLLANTDYRVNKLVMKRCHVAGDTFTLGVPSATPGYEPRNKERSVKFDHDFYMAVFEFTQGQWEVVAGKRKIGDCRFKVQDWQLRPCTHAFFPACRESDIAKGTADDANAAYRYPHQPHETSLFGIIHSRSGVWVDFPSENQWEVAMRPGHTAYGWYGVPISVNNTTDYKDENFPERYKYNGGNLFNGSAYSEPSNDYDANYGTAKVGSYKPNQWGFYDFCGNVCELILDSWANPPSSTEEPKMVDGSTQTVVKGTSWNGTAKQGPAGHGIQGFVTNNKHAGWRVVSNDGFRDPLWK